MKNRYLAFCAGGLALYALGCSSPDASVAEVNAVERGRALFHSTELSRSDLNAYQCATCHDAQQPGGVLKTGAIMAGVTQRTSYWGGQENDLLRSINQCRNYFMLDNAPLSAQDENAQALFEYLNSLTGSNEPVAFDLIQTIDSQLPRGDAERGLTVYYTACATCHGVIHSGDSRLSSRVPILPEDTLVEHATYTRRDQRLVFIEKIRHGGFYGYGGDMPPFSRELLSEAQLSDLLEALGILGE